MCLPYAIPDCYDHCKYISGDNAYGCPSCDEDTDGDGIEDCIDECPEEQGDTATGCPLQTAQQCSAACPEGTIPSNNENNCGECIPDPNNKWYFSADTDNYHAKGTSQKTQPESPGNGWILGVSSGEDCDDEKPNLGANCADEEEDPCDDIKSELKGGKLNEKLTELKGKLKSEREFGFKKQFGNNQNFDELDIYRDNRGNPVFNELRVVYNSNTKGLIHTHPIGLEPIFSPQDIGTFLDIIDHVDKNSNNDIKELYSAVVTKKGQFILKFTGDVEDLSNNQKPTQKLLREQALDDDLKESYRDYIDNNSYEVAILRFLRFKMQIKGITLFEVTGKGKVLQHKLREDNLTKLKKIPCP